MRVVTNNERMESIRDNAVNVMEIIEVVRAVHEDGIKPGPGFVSQLDEAIIRLNDIVDDSKESIVYEYDIVDTRRPTLSDYPEGTEF